MESDARCNRAWGCDLDSLKAESKTLACIESDPGECPWIGKILILMGNHMGIKHPVSIQTLWLLERAGFAGTAT